MLILLQGFLSGENEEASDDEINYFVLAANTTIPNDAVVLNNENLTAGLYETENVAHDIENVQIGERSNCPTREGFSHNNGSGNDDDIDLEHRNTVNNDLSQREGYLNDADADDDIDDDIDSIDNDNDNGNNNDTDNEPEDDRNFDSDETDFHVDVEVYFIIIVFW